MAITRSIANTSMRSADHPEFSVVMPVFNSQDIVRETLDRTSAFFRGRGWSHEIIAVNGGSRDRSRDVPARADRDGLAVGHLSVQRLHGVSHLLAFLGEGRGHGVLPGGCS